jgi:hypothetical protein
MTTEQLKMNITNAVKGIFLYVIYGQGIGREKREKREKDIIGICVV